MLKWIRGIWKEYLSFFRPVLLSSVRQSSKIKGLNFKFKFCIKNLCYFQKMTTLLSYRLLQAPFRLTPRSGLGHCGYHSNKYFCRRWQGQVHLFISNTTIRHPFDTLVNGMGWGAWLVTRTLQVITIIDIPHICHRHHRRCLCKKRLPSVNFYRFNAKNWQFTV